MKSFALTDNMYGYTLLCCLVVVLLAPNRSCAQTDNTQRTISPPSIYRVDAFAGTPFGVGVLRYRMSDADHMIDQSGATMLTEANNRILYPVFTKPAAARFFQRLAGNPSGDPESIHNVWFLFRGDQPLELTLHGSDVATETVDVEYAREKKFSRMISQWWREFDRETKQQQDWGDYPPLIETYLKSMLSRRLELPLPSERLRKKDPLTETLELIFDVESLRSQTIEDAMLGFADHGPAENPLPSDVFWGFPELDEADYRNVEVEPFASCIPEECFYLRFGNWNNQIWLRNLMEENGGDLSRMVNLRGHKSRVQSKFLNQLAIESTEFDRLFGGNLIADVAVVGNDMFFEDGSSVGVLLYAKNTKSLTGNLTSKRKKFAAKHKDLGCEVDYIDVNGVKVQFLRTPDNRYRSFYVVRNDCHLVASSISLVRRFIEASAGKGALASSLEFRYARQQMPLSREDTVFVFVPSKFLYKLLGPGYQIELARRNRSITDMQIFELAMLAARNEGLDVSADPTKLNGTGFLPDQFGGRPDGSVLSRNKEIWVDSVRGQRGYFVPIPDVEISGVTQQELDWYARRREFLSNNLSQLDAMFVGLKRYEHENNIERVVYDARIAPFGQEKYAWLFSMLGPPIAEQIKGASNDVISFQASLSGGAISRRINDHQLFGAIQDEMQVSRDVKPNSFIRSLDLLRSAPGYIASWPKAGFLDWLPKLGGKPDEDGYTYSRMFGLWRLQWDDFSAVSFDQHRLQELRDQVKIVKSDRPAQVRVKIGDVGNSKLRNWVNTSNYRRSWEVSIANARLLNMMSQQFNLPPQQARQIVEDLLDVDLVCSLGGQYELTDLPQRMVWQSTAWPDFSDPLLPEDYAAPMLKWFRGLELELMRSDSQFVVHGYLDIERSPGSSLPSFNLFKGFGKMFGGEKEKTKDPETIHR